MEIKIIPMSHDGSPFVCPERKHSNDVGADVYCPKQYQIEPGQTVKIPLGFGLEVPAGLAGFIYPRSSLAAAGLHCALPPIDPTYRGEIHAIITNMAKTPITLEAWDRIGQLVVMPVVLPVFTLTLDESRGAGAFGSTGA